MSTLVDPPIIRARYPFEFFFQFSNDALGFLARAAKTHGDICCFKVGPGGLTF